MKRVLPLVLAGLLIGLFCGSCAAQDKPEPVTAILGAFDAEVEILREAVDGKRHAEFLGVAFTLGWLQGRRVVLAQTGVGKVNAAMTTTLLIEHFSPSEVIFTGIAGGINPELHPGDIVIGAYVAHHDFVAVSPDGLENMATRNPVSGSPNPIKIPSDQRLRDLAREAGQHAELRPIATTGGERTPRVVEGVIVTGDSFIASSSKKRELRGRLQADAVEMEGAAVAQVCYQTHTPCVVIRSLSDNADEAAARDLERFYQTAAHNSARLVIAMARLLARDRADEEPIPREPSPTATE